jgi:dephospho-CoA kinase
MSFEAEPSFTIDRINKTPIVAVCGPMASGKGTVAEYLHNKFGFAHLKMSQMLRDYAGNAKLDRAGIDEVVDRIEEKFGANGLARVILERVDHRQRTDPASGVIIDGIRYSHVAAYLRAIPSTTVVWLHAPQNVRFQRTLGRERRDDLTTWEDFVAKDDQELAWMAGIPYLADLRLDTTHPLQEVQQIVHSVIAEKFFLADQ